MKQHDDPIATICRAVATLSLAALTSASGAAGREVFSLDQGWRFHLGELGEAPAAAAAPGSPAHPAYDDHDWRVVDVPHDYVIEGTFVNGDPEHLKHGGLPLEVGWYRRTLRLPPSAAGKRAWLEFDGVYRDSLYWLDGQYLGANKSGYIGRCFELGPVSVAGKSPVLAVRVDPRKPEGWWYDGGGLYRHVRLVLVEPVHVAPWGVFIRASVEKPGAGVHAAAVLKVSTDIANQTAAPAAITVLQEVLDDRGQVVASSEAPQELPVGEGTNLQTMAMPDARLWSCEHPALYTLRTTLRRGGESLDRVANVFGVRDIRFDAERGFFLNGQPVKIKGVCNHQDHAGVGVAQPGRLQAWRLEQLRKVGVNGLRCAHNAQAPELLDACDRLGILVLDEFRKFEDPESKVDPGAPGDRFEPHAAQVLRDRNHPSVILWSLANELIFQDDPKAARIGTALKALVNRLDGTRPLTAGLITHSKARKENGPDANNPAYSKDGLTGVVDLLGFNYSPQAWEKVHADYPGKPAVVTELTRMVNTRGIYERQPIAKGKEQGDAARGLANQYGTAAETAWSEVARHPWLAGAFIWCGYDFKGEPKPVAWPPIGAQKGLLDSCGFWKDSTWYYKAWWNKEPSIHVFPHWNWAGKEGQDIPVWVFANADQVELFLNGHSLEKKSMQPNSHLEWSVKYQPGTLEARGYWRGKTLSNTVVTTGAPARVVLEPDRATLAADGEDLSVITVKVVDTEGRVVPTAMNLVRFTVTGVGKNIGVGNGDPACHEPDKADRRSAYWGLCQLLVQAGRTAGDITVRAESDGLAPATARLTAH